jgi:hypothetical protein
LPLAIALLVGLAAGLYYAWVVNPVEYVDSAPASLRQPYRDNYLQLIAAAYAQQHDVTRARARLSLLDDPHLTDTLAALAQRQLARGGSEQEARALAELAGLVGPTPAPGTITPGAATTNGIVRSGQTPTPPHISTPSRTPTATATPGAPFQLSTEESICDAQAPAPLLEVVVLNSASQPVAYAEVVVVWDSGQDHFFTGLKPELGLGYGDFDMVAGVIYTVQLEHSAGPVTGLQAPVCSASDGSSLPGSLRLTFIQPKQ